MDRRGCLGLGGVVFVALELGLDAVDLDVVVPAVLDPSLDAVDRDVAVLAVPVVLDLVTLMALGMDLAYLSVAVLAVLNPDPMTADLGGAVPVAAGRGSADAEDVLLSKLSVHPPPKQFPPLAVFPPALDSLNLQKSSHLLPELPPLS